MRGDGQERSPRKALGAFMGLVCQSRYVVPGLPAYSLLQCAANQCPILASACPVKFSVVGFAFFSSDFT
jgi:hypothetical protein